MAVRSFTAGMEEETVDEPMAIGSFCDNVYKLRVVEIGAEMAREKKKKSPKGHYFTPMSDKEKGCLQQRRR